MASHTAFIKTKRMSWLSTNRTLDKFKRKSKNEFKDLNKEAILNLLMFIAILSID